MPWDRDGNWYDDPNEQYNGPLSPYEVAHRDGRGDEFDAAVNAYYNAYPNGDASGTAQDDTNWFDSNTWAPPSYYGNTGTPEQPGPVPPPPRPPPPPPPPPPPRPTGGGGGGTTASSFSWPSFTAPQLPTIAPLAAPPPFSYAAYEPGPSFSYDSFSAPTLEQAQNEPGYEFARSEGIRALQNARLPTLRTGGTMKDLIGWGNRFAEQNYGNVYNRAANTYTLNRGNAFENWAANERQKAEAYDRNRGNAADAYKMNWGVTTDVYDRNSGTALDLFDRQFRNAMAEFDPRMLSAQLTFADMYNRDRDKLDALTRISTAGAGL